MDARISEDIKKVYDFHRKKSAPGIPLGVYMVELAFELLDGLYPDRNSYVLNALCETRVCLPDAIQVMTGCTFANKYLRLDAIKNGRYALVLYNRDTSIGYRVFVDLKKIDGEKFPNLLAFFKKTRDYKVRSRDEYSKMTLEEIYAAGRSILSSMKVRVAIPAKDDIAPALTCEACGESYLVEGNAADAAQKKCPYCVSAQKGNAPFSILDGPSGN